jgi:S-DNA-T family DNA segregation ATPase FtsK/SpoIIIE
LFGAAALGLFAIFYGLAVLSYSAGDAAYNSAAADVQHNWMGQSGAYVADAVLFLFGVPAIFLLPLMLVFARRLWRDVPQPQWKRQLSLCLIGMLLIGFGMAYWQQGSDIGLPAGWGGFIASGVAHRRRLGRRSSIGHPIASAGTAIVAHSDSYDA